MFCLKCQYPLTQVQTKQCPECGCAFDSNNAETYASHPNETAVMRWMWRALFAIAASPVILGLCVIVLWLVAFKVLGRAPRVSLDDPKGIPIVKIFATPLMVLYILSLIASLVVASLLVLARILSVWNRSTPGGMHLFHLLLISAGSLALQYGAGWTIPAYGTIFAWLMD